jgi:hypothetical protein
MAEHSSQGGHQDLGDHRATYEGFIKGAIVLCLVTAFIMVALVSFRFASFLNVFLGFAGLIIGILAVLIEARTMATRWIMPIVVLVIFGLITAINIG